MPNWCNNTFKVSGEKEDIDKFEKFLEEKNGKGWFDFFAPCPEELKNVGEVSVHHTNEELIAKYGHSDWYSWSVENWGTKWNCDAQDWNRNENEISFWFDSAWGPPTELYHLIEDNFDMTVAASYNEEGMQFVGEFIGGDNFTYEYTDLDSLDNVPEHLVEEWNLRDSLELMEEDEWEESEELLDEEDENDGK
jgi:hypothetical protein